MKLPRPRQALIGVALIAFALLGAACESDAPQDFLNEQSGKVAERADQLWDITFAIAVIVFVLVEGALVYALIKFRQRPGKEAAQFHGNTRVEIVLTVIPSLILLGLGIPTLQTIFDQAEEVPGALDIKVVARQFWWEYQYDIDDDGEPDFINANEMHIPTDTPILLTLEGDIINQDVIHSFWVPRLAGTQDVVPGRTNLLNISADEPGEFWGQCKEYCGLSHANMRLRVIAEPIAEFEQWADEQSEPAAAPSESLAREGAELFVGGTEGGAFADGPACATCHTIDGLEGAAGTVGPNLTHLASRGTFGGAMFELGEGPLRDWLGNPPEMKPGSRMPDLGLTAEEIDALVAYLMSLE